MKINALLTIPNGMPPTAGWPAVVFVHGYIPPEEYQTTDSYSSYIDSLAGNGIAILKIDLRGHGKSEGKPGGSYYSADYVIDTLNAYSALANYKNIDRNKTGLWGHSMAGNIIFRSFVINPEIKKVVIWGGAVYTYEDLGTFSINDATYKPLPSDSPVQQKREELIETFGQFNKEDSFWSQTVPTNYLSGLTGSIQVHHALDDSVVSIDYSRNLMNILDQTTILHTLYEYPSGGHDLTGNSFNQAIERTADFIKN